MHNKHWFNEYALQIKNKIELDYYPVCDIYCVIDLLFKTEGNTHHQPDFFRIVSMSRLQ